MRVSAAFASVLVITAWTVAALETPAAASSSIESRVLAHVNAGRTTDLRMHSGLVGIGRTHSRRMAAEGDLDHGDVEGRIRSAPPDPYEANGSPDDGFTQAWCENVAYAGDPERRMTEAEVARTIYETWRKSAPHQRCMVKADVTVAGVGVYYDADEQTWWATLDAVEDRTPPGSPTMLRTPSPSAPPTSEIVDPPLASEAPRGTLPETTSAPEPARALAQLATPPPTPTPRSEQTPRVRSTFNRRIAASTIDHSYHGPLGWQELMAALGIAVATVLSYRGYARRAA